ncbi:O-acyltransferase WSD1 [Zostera marina]|uniref:O-acyltransferase WSD1 n=1 Tax=Zostera marina TaxID=29655 RepID=A0A0K9NNT9_ZOSMR|nr:O-acyltransferase WSD1 [Zostera marina]
MGEDGDLEPLSPTTQYFSTSALSVCIIVAFEMDRRFQEDSEVIELVDKLLLPINPRFSSVKVRDVNGLQQWKKVDVKIEDHVISPSFSNPMSIDASQRHIRDYISNLRMNPFSQSRPLWEVHNIKYPTADCDGTLVLKLDHSLGDGFSLMGALFSRLRRADHPSLPLTFPHSKNKRPPQHSHLFSTTFYTARDFLSSLIKTNFVQDEISPIRSATPTSASQISTFTLPLHKIHKIKTSIGGTVNDVIVGIISYGTRLYMEKMSSIGGRQHDSKPQQLNVTALVLLNTRAIKTYQTLTIDEVTNDPNKNNSGWGNHFGFLQIPIPSVERELVSTTPLDLVFKIKEILTTKRNSLAVYLTGWLLDMLRRIKGPEAAGRYIAKTIRNTSFGISNLIGPLEKMEIGGHPVNAFYFSVVGTPHSLGFSVVSYMEKLTVAVCTEKKLIDSEMLVSCLDIAFRQIFEQAT